MIYVISASTRLSMKIWLVEGLEQQQYGFYQVVQGNT